MGQVKLMGLATALAAALTVAITWACMRRMRGPTEVHDTDRSARADRTDRADPTLPYALEPLPIAIGSGFATHDAAATSGAGGQLMSTSAPVVCARLARTIERSRRLLVVEERVALELAQLPDADWLVERYVRIGSARVPFVVVGPPGLFVLAASDSDWTLASLRDLAEAAQRLGVQTPEFGGRAFSAICLAFDDASPRCWFDAAAPGAGGWVLGIEWLQRWLDGVSPGDSVDPGLIRAMALAAGPFWERAVAHHLPRMRNRG